jgi:hypothetical protein
MAHPYQSERQTKVEHRRVAHITKGYASGGAVHDDEAEDRALIRKSVKPSALRMEGGGTKSRADRRARGGRTSKKGGKTVVNVITGGPHPAPAPMMPPPAGPPPMAGAPPMMPPRPPMMPPQGGPPMPPRSDGGRAYAKGGAVAFGPAYKEGVRAGTQVTHSPGKNDGKNIGRGKPITYKTGGKVEALAGVAKATKLPGGSGGGEARLAKQSRAARDYAKA